MSTVAIILLATFTVGDFARIRVERAEELGSFEMELEIAAPDTEKERGNFAMQLQRATPDNDKAFEGEATSAADGAEADSADALVTAFEHPAAFVQEAVSQRMVSSPGPNAPGTIPNFFSVKKRKVHFAKALPPPPLLPPPPPSSFAKTLDYVNRANGPSRVAILKAACDSSAFSCDEIIQLAISVNEAKLFAEGRNNSGCISDPVNAKSIRDSIESIYPSDWRSRGLLRELDEAFIDNEGLKPAKGVEALPIRLQTSLRTGADMEKLLGDMRQLQLIKAFGLPGARGAYRPGSPSVTQFETWLKQIRAHGEQFSGPQLVTLVEAIPKAPLVGGYYANSGTSKAVSVLLQYLEQYVAGVTCEQVKQIMRWMMAHDVWRYDFAEGFDALKSNIVDGPNKVDIIAFTDSLNHFMVQGTERALQDVGVGLPPKNNPIFGVVQGNPVILVVDESTSMDDNFSLGNDIFTRRNFCNSQLDEVLVGLPNGTYFNVIRYSSSAVKIFQKPVLISKTNIDAAMQGMGTMWRSGYTPGQDPVKMLRDIKVFAMKIPGIERNSLKALQLAYATAGMPSQQTYDEQLDLFGRGELSPSKDLPQIYFLTSGQPDGRASEILQNIDEFDKGRNIPVNSIAFITPLIVDLAAKQFVKDLAHKTGGFFRSIEQASLNLKTHNQEEEKCSTEKTNKKEARKKVARALWPDNLHSMKTRRMK